MGPAVVFDNVSKKFRRGERHNSLRDLVPSLVHGLFRARSDESLGTEEFWALRNLSFEVSPGEALGIIGPNGAGKSTTLKVLTRILKPTSGLSAVKGRVGALIEVAAGFHPDLTGRENILLQGAIMGMKRAEITERFDEIVEFAGVSDFIDTPVKRYSSGMNARLGFSIAAHLRPDVLIIDEVLSVGDMAFQQKCYRRMEEFVRQGVSIVLVSHNLTAVSQLCRRVVLLKAGMAVSQGPPQEVIAEYSRSLMTAESTTDAPVDLKLSATDHPGERSWIIASGARVQFRLFVETRVRLRGVIGVAVWDLTKDMYVYGVTSDSVGIPLLDFQPGDSATYEFEFVANLTRGAYSIEVSVFDTGRQVHLARVNPAATFNVGEQVTHLGVANLFVAGSRLDAAAETVTARKERPE